MDEKDYVVVWLVGLMSFLGLVYIFLPFVVEIAYKMSDVVLRYWR